MISKSEIINDIINVENLSKMRTTSIDLDKPNTVEIVIINPTQSSAVTALAQLEIAGDKEDLRSAKISDSEGQTDNIIPGKSMPELRNEIDTLPSKTLDTQQQEDEGGSNQNKYLEKKESLAENSSPEKPIPLLKMYQIRASRELNEIEFKFGVFVEFLLYHIAFFFFLGPIIPLLLRPIVGKTILKNQLFWGIKSFKQTAHWLLIVSSIALFSLALFFERKGNVFPIEMVSLIIIVLLRILFISSKYAYATPTFLAHFRSRELTPEEIKNEMMTTQFMYQDEAFIHQQVQESILRLGIDTASFYFTFLGHDPVQEVNTVAIKRHSLESAEGALHESKASRDKKKRRSKKSVSAPICQPDQRKGTFSLGSIFFMKSNSTQTTNSTEARSNQTHQTRLESQGAEDPQLQSQNIQTQIELQVTENRIQVSDGRMQVTEERLQIRKNARRQSGKFSKATKSRNVIPADIRDLSIPEGTFKTFQKLMLKEHELEKTMHSGYTLAVELAIRAVGSRFKYPHITTRITALVRAALPLIVREIVGIPIIGLTPLEIYLNISIMIITFHFFWINLTIVTVIVNASKTKLHLLSELSNLLPNKRIDGPKKTHPPLNIFNAVSLRSWQDFRWVLMDYGYKFEVRLGLNVTFYLVVYLVQLLIIVLFLLNLIHIPIDWATIIIGLFEAIVALGVFLHLLIRGAMINDYFPAHRNLLLNCRGIISDLKTMAPLYFGERPIEPDHELKREGIKYLREVYKFKKEGLAEVCVLHLKQLEEIIDRIITQLDNYEFNHCFKILGFRITFQFVRAVFLGIISIAVAIINVQLKDRARVFNPFRYVDR